MNRVDRGPDVLFALPVPRFYSQLGGIGGCVAHAHGVMQALLALGGRLDVLAAERPVGEVVPAANWLVLPTRRTDPVRRYLWGRSFVAAVRRAVARNSYDYCYMRYSVQFAPLVPAVKAALGGVPLVLELNSFAAQRPGWPWRVFAPLERRALAAADLVLCVSEHLQDDVTRLFGQGVTERCLVVPNGVDPTRFELAGPAATGSPAPTLCYCGVLKPGYGLEDLLAVHRDLERDIPGLTLHLVGDGPVRRSLADSPDRGRNVVFHGAVDFGDVPSLLMGMDVLVHTTTRAHFFQSPIKLYEYMCAARPIVAADQPQTRIVLGGDPPAGLLFEAGSRDSLRQALARMLAEPELAAAMAQQARALVVRDHTWGQRVYGLHRELTARRLIS